MNLVDQISADLKAAMKEKDELRLSVLRLMRSAVKNKEIDVQHALSDEEAQAVVRTMVKQGKDAMADFTNAGRQDLIDRQQAELEILFGYLPAMMSESEVEAICRQTIETAGALGPQDMGKAMSAAMKIIAGRADGVLVRNVIQRLLVNKSSAS